MIIIFFDFFSPLQFFSNCCTLHPVYRAIHLVDGTEDFQNEGRRKRAPVENATAVAGKELKDWPFLTQFPLVSNLSNKVEDHHEINLHGWLTYISRKKQS